MNFGFGTDEWKNSFWLKVAIILYIVMWFSFIIFGYTVLPYLISIAAFLIISTYIFKSPSFPSIFLTRMNKCIAIFSLAILLRVFILIQDQIITNDIEFYIFRSQMMLEGNIPYIDFYGGSKPPLYNYMLFVMGYILTPGFTQFRAVFIVTDALLAVNIFMAGRIFFNDNWGFRLGVVYALCPLCIITIGLSGHYEPVILMFVITSLIFYHMGNRKLSGLSLGTAFALKVFPIVILPFILVILKSWKERIQYIILFTVPMALSWIPLIILSPKAILYFLNEESGWGGSLTFSFLFKAVTDLDSVLGIKTTWLIMGFFIFLMFLMFMSWILIKDKFGHSVGWYKIVLIITVINYSIGIPIAFIFYGVEITPIKVFLMVVLPLAGFYLLFLFVWKKYLSLLIPESIHKEDHLTITSIFAIMLFIYGLPNFAPWYLLWYFPLVLLVRTKRIRLTLFWLMFWHHTGVAVYLLPGIIPVN